MAKEHLRRTGLENRIYGFEVSSVTVGLAAQAVGCESARITKTLPFMVDQRAVLIVVAGDAKVDNHRYNEQFHTKARTLSSDEVTEIMSHSVGGACPFGVKEGVSMYLDESLKRFGVVYPACGSASSTVKLTILELETASEYLGWTGVCKGWKGEWQRIQIYLETEEDDIISYLRMGKLLEDAGPSS